MKTAIKNLVAFAITTVVLTASTASAFATDVKNETVLTAVKKVNKINVSGNVELILVQSADESVKVYDNYYAKNALVQQKNGELRIASFSKETLTVVVYVTNLTEVTASDNASVKTSGKLNLLGLEVNLKDRATANLNINTLNLYTNLAGTANLTLSGTTESYSSLMESFAQVNMVNFSAESSLVQSKNTVIAKVVPTMELPDAE
jgi:hypothetical protein